MGEILFLLFIAFMCVLSLFEVSTYKTAIVDNSGGPGFFPRIIATLVLIFIVIIIIQKLLNKEDQKKYIFTELFTGIRGVFLLSFIIYTACLNVIGFLISSILFVCFMVNYFYFIVNGSLGGVRKISIRAVSLVFSVVVLYFIFGNVFKIQFPTGIMWG